MTNDFLGSGLLAPFQRDGKGDFANARGAKLIESAIKQIVGTRAESAISGGELPWRTDAGSWIHLLRHRNNTPAFREAARVYIQSAIRRWEPRVEVLVVTPVNPDRISELNKPVIRIRWRFIERNVPGNRVLFGPVTTEVEL